MSFFCQESQVYDCLCHAPFNLEDLRLIKAMCVTACPQYPNVPMWEPWASLYAKADRIIERI